MTKGSFVYRKGEEMTISVCCKCKEAIKIYSDIHPQGKWFPATREDVEYLERTPISHSYCLEYKQEFIEELEEYKNGEEGKS